jgi:thiol-disulfide isomerase/thioredoxin
VRGPVALIVLALLVAGCAGVDARTSETNGVSEDTSAGPAEAATSTTTTTPIPDLGPAPELVGLDGWLQSDVSSLGELRGKVVVVQFWTFGCYNCKNTLPNLRALYEEHQGDDFEIVGVHAPEFDYEKDPAAISEAAAALGVTWPIALDTDKQNFRSWQGSPAYWPRTFVVDQAGRLRFDRIGEGAYDQLNQTVARLLG